MKKKGIINSDIARVLAKMGHTDRICIGDCGLPIPEDVERIDLSLRLGSPTFIEVLEEIVKDFEAESIVLAEEIKEQNSDALNGIESIFNSFETGFKKEFVSHEDFKRLTKDCKAVIRTGETSPYANIILQSGCIF